MEELLNIYEKSNKEWLHFSSVANNNLKEIDSGIEEVENKLHTIQGTINNIKTLSEHAQAKSYIKICPKAYVAATIRHTGEYNVQMNSEYQCTLTKDQTIEYLEEQLAEQNGILENFKLQKNQLLERLGIEYSNIDDVPDLSNMPEKIINEKGIAFKQGPFFEIMEIESDVPYEKNKKRISRVNHKTDNNLATDLHKLDIN